MAFPFYKVHTNLPKSQSKLIYLLMMIMQELFLLACLMKNQAPLDQQLLPFLSWLPNYKKEWLSGDLSAGLTVGVMLIPQGMAYAMIAGLPPIHGLYASTIPLVLYALLGTSRQLAVGPVAMVSLLTAAGIGALNPESPEVYLYLAVTLAFIRRRPAFLAG